MRNEVILQKLYSYSEKLMNYCQGYTYGSFSEDTKLAEACVFNLSQMGELCRLWMLLLQSVILKYPGVK